MCFNIYSANGNGRVGDSCFFFESVQEKNNSSQANIQILDLQKLPTLLRCRYIYI